jgi:probable phosphoglycerate mutase
MGRAGEHSEPAVNYPHRILFIRHGETDYNAEGRLQGQLDIALNGKGREQASSVGRTLAKRLRAEIDRLEAANAFRASPLLRVRETLELARAAMGLEPTRYGLDDGLKELTFGDWEGFTWPEIEAIDPAGAAAREREKWRFVPPNGESYADLAERIAIWLSQQSSDLFVASHGGVARALMYLLGGVDEDTAANANIFQGRALVFEPGAKFRWVG